MNLKQRQFLPDSEIERAVKCAVRSITRRRGYRALSEDDLFQEGMVWAIEHMDDYREAKASIMTFLFRPVKTHLNRVIRKEARASGLLLPENEEELRQTAEALPQFPDIQRVFSYEPDLALQIDIRMILEILTPEERNIITDRFMNKVRLKDLARYHGISESAMHHRITKIIQRLRLQLGNEYATYTSS